MSCCKFVVLDFDGVLTSEDDGTSHKVALPSDYAPSKMCIEKLKRLLDTCNAKILLATNWRKFSIDGCLIYRNRTYQNPIPKIFQELGDYIFDILPTDRDLTKSEALILWFEDNDKHPMDCDFVIFDDRDEEGYGENPFFQDRFIKTSAKTGITDVDINRAIEILN